MSWGSMLYLRTDFSIPMLAVGVCLGALGFIKAATGIVRLKQSALSQELTEAF